MAWMFSFIPLGALDEKRLIASFEEWYIKIKGDYMYIYHNGLIIREERMVYLHMQLKLYSKMPVGAMIISLLGKLKNSR